jgi:hypothetical protein
MRGATIKKNTSEFDVQEEDFEIEKKRFIEEIHKYIDVTTKDSPAILFCLLSSDRNLNKEDMVENKEPDLRISGNIKILSNKPTQLLLLETTKKHIQEDMILQGGNEQ